MAKATVTEDPGRQLMAKFLEYLLGRLDEATREASIDGAPPTVLQAAELSVIRQLLADNAITFSSVQRGDFGAFAKKAAEEFPVSESGEKLFQ